MVRSPVCLLCAVVGVLGVAALFPIVSELSAAGQRVRRAAPFRPASNRIVPGSDWWRIYPWSPYNYGRNPYNPIVVPLTRRRMDAGKSVITRGSMTPSAFLVLLAVPTMITMFVSFIVERAEQGVLDVMRRVDHALARGDRQEVGGHERRGERAGVLLVRDQVVDEDGTVRYRLARPGLEA